MKILVAEDDPLMSKILEYRLKMDRHEVMVTRDGSDALAKIEKFHPDLFRGLPAASGAASVRGLAVTAHG